MSNLTKEEVQQKAKADFIGNYLNKKMKGHGLPYGMAYLNLLSRMDEKAERAWERQNKSINH